MTIDVERWGSGEVAAPEREQVHYTLLIHH